MLLAWMAWLCVNTYGYFPPLVAAGSSHFTALASSSVQYLKSTANWVPSVRSSCKVVAVLVFLTVVTVLIVVIVFAVFVMFTVDSMLMVLL